jgi:RNA polymerase sigma factor (sigma-70 family)
MPPTRREAWAAVLDNPRLVQFLANRVGGGEDAIADAQIALMETFLDFDPGRASVLTLARWRLIRMHRATSQVLDPPKSRFRFIRAFNRENERRMNLGKPALVADGVDRVPPRWTIARVLLEGASRERIEPENHAGVHVRLREEWVHLEDLVAVDPVEREDHWPTHLYRVIRTLPRRERRILRAIVLEGKTTREVGDELRVTKQRVSQLFQSLLTKLRRRLDGPKKEG